MNKNKSKIQPKKPVVSDKPTPDQIIENLEPDTQKEITKRVFGLTAHYQGFMGSIAPIIIEKFLQDTKIAASPDFQSILGRIDDIANKLGCQDYLFKEKESRFSDAVVALNRGNLRLYCCRYGNIILILDSGGIKDTRTYQESPKLNQSINMMAYISNRIDQRIKDKDIKIIPNQFKGDLNFD